MSLPSKKKLTELFKYYERKAKPIELDVASASASRPDIVHISTTDDRVVWLRSWLETKKVDDILDMANDLLDGHGVEAIRGDYHVDNYYGDIVALYVNMGDPYVPTLLYNTERGSFYVGGYGDWVTSPTAKKYRIY